MIITFEGRDWEFDETAITVRQGIAIYLAHHITIAEFSEGLVTLDPRALQAGYWLMLQQNSVIKPIADCDFEAVKFAEAYANGRLAEQAAERAAAEAAARAVPEPAGPTSLPPGDPAWSGHGYQTDTTQQPGPLTYRSQDALTGYSASP